MAEEPRYKGRADGEFCLGHEEELAHMELLSQDREALQKIAEYALQFCFAHADDVQLCSLAGTLVKGMEELCAKARLVGGGYTAEQASSLLQQAQQLQMAREAEARRHPPQICEMVGTLGGGSS